VLIGVEATWAWLVQPQRSLAATTVVLAPGLAALPFLPRELRRLPFAVPAVPVVGVVLAQVVLVGAAALAVPLDPLGVRLTLAGVAVAGLIGGILLPTPAFGAPPERWPSVLLGLAAVVGLGIAMQWRILGSRPIPGEDWGEYLLYAQEIARRHSLLIDNPFWMLGGDSFPLDPGAPSLYGATLALADAPAASLLQGIWVFAVLGILSLFVFVGTLWGSRAGLVAAAVYAVVPMNLNVLSWHGLPTVDAFVIIPVALLATGMALRGEAGRRWAAVLAVALVGLAAAHRVGFLLGAVAVAFVLAVALVRQPRPTVRFMAWTAVFGIVAGAGVAVDLVQRTLALGGVQGYEAFLPTKVHWDLVARDVTWPLTVAGLAALALVVLGPWFRRDASRFVLLGLGATILALSYAWLVHLPTSYNRASYLAPMLLAASLGLLASRLPVRVVAPLAALLVGVTALEARSLATDYRRFYSHVDAASLKGLGYVSQRARPGDAVVTDQCWSFLSTWLLQRPVLAALDPALILPKRELEPVAKARRILYGRDGERLAATLGVRYALVDPLCTYQTGRPFGPPASGHLVYASTRLLVFDLATDGQTSSR
jgi:hypothetical protein